MVFEDDQTWQVGESLLIHYSILSGIDRYMAPEVNIYFVEEGPKNSV